MNIPNYPLSTIPYASPASSGVLNDIISEIDQNFDTLKTDAEAECQSIRDDTAVDRQAIRDETAADRQAIRNEMEADFNTTHLQQVPIGSIIGLHPYVDISKVINTEYWIHCDGIGTFKFTYADGTQSVDINVPNLTDSRFLMGGTEYGRDGDNFLKDHTHGCLIDTHNHGFSLTAAGQGGGGHTHKIRVPNSSSGTSGYGHEKPTIGSAWWCNDTANILNGPDIYSYSKAHTHSSSSVSGSISDNAHTHVIGAGDLPGSTSNLPQYFKVLYYIRIK